jgi:hypothetical protein
LETFYVHEKLVTTRSEFFKRAASGLWQQDATHLVNLPEDDPDVFKIYLNLVYTGQLATQSADEWIKLCRLYVLAEKLQDLQAKNETIKGMYAYCGEKADPIFTGVAHRFPAAATKELYEGTPERSQARKLIADLYGNCADERWLKGAIAEFPAEFYHDVLVRLLKKRSAVRFGWTVGTSSRSSYYEADITSEAKETGGLKEDS